MKIFYLTREYADTHRADVRALFGRYLPRYDFSVDLCALSKTEKIDWPAGEFAGWIAPKNRALRWLAEILFPALLPFNRHLYQADVLIIRDKAFAGVVALVLGKLLNKPVYYWMSFPFPEGYRELARLKKPPLSWLHALRARITSWLLYRCVLPNTRHNFVQSEAMAVWLTTEKGIAPQTMTPVPMGVDLEQLAALDLPSRQNQQVNSNLLVYIGTLERPRRMDILLEMMALLQSDYPDLRLLLIGDASDKAGREWFQQRIQETQTEHCVEVTGWLPMEDAWRLASSALLGLSPIPPGPIFDVSSPTKVGEYLAMGIPAVANNNNDQKKVLQESSAGVCVDYTAAGFAAGVRHILQNPDQYLHQASQQGPAYIQRERSYAQLAGKLAQTLKAQGVRA